MRPRSPVPLAAVHHSWAVSWCLFILFSKLSRLSSEPIWSDSFFEAPAYIWGEVGRYTAHIFLLSEIYSFTIIIPWYHLCSEPSPDWNLAASHEESLRISWQHFEIFQHVKAKYSHCLVYLIQVNVWRTGPAAATQSSLHFFGEVKNWALLFHIVRKNSAAHYFLNVFKVNFTSYNSNVIT